MPTVDPDAGTGGGGGGTSGGSTSSGGSSGGSTSTSSGGGGRSAPVKLTQAQVLAEHRANRAIAELRRSYLELLRRWGIPSNKNLMNLIEKGVRKAWSSTQFLAMVRHTPEYRKKYPGIQWKLGMTEGQYLSTYSQYKARAQDIGVQLTSKEFARMLQRGVDFEEYSDRVDALSSIRSYGPMWEAFKNVLDERGLKVPGKELEKKELVKFLMGQGSKEWEHAWQETLVSVNLEQVAGVQIIGTGERAGGTQYDIMRGDLVEILRQVEALTPGFNAEDISSRDWAEIGKSIRRYPMSYLQRYGLTTKDLLEMELGGPRAAEIGIKAERILKEQEAFFEPRPVPQFAQQVGRPQEEELPQSQ